MKPLTSTKTLAAAGLVLGALFAATAAQARSDVFLSIGVQGAPGVYVQPAPVYVQPRPVYVAPRLVYTEPRPVYVPAPRYYGNRGPYGDYDRDGIANVYDRDGWRHRRHVPRFGPYGDLDRDGIANYADRDIDGDGIRNRRDRFPENPRRY